MLGKPPDVFDQSIVFWLYGVGDSRPAVTKASLPPSGRLAFDLYRSASTDKLDVACQLVLSPISDVVTLRSIVWLTISGVNVFAVNEVIRPFLTTTLDHSGLPS